MTGLLFDVRKYSVHDGPGIRTAFFLKGCPLSCAWCHNPEGLSATPELLLRPDRCLGAEECGECAKVCSRGAARPPGAEAEPADGPGALVCSACGLCAEACPAEARQIVGFRMTVDEALAKALEDEPFYDESGGGVTFTGGEPLAQPGFLLECLAAFRARGLRTAVDTSGYAPPGVLSGAAALTDLFLYDLKHMDDREHERWTGVPNDRILENLRMLCDGGAAVWIRIPLIPGVNDSDGNLEASADFLSSLGFSGGPGGSTARAVQILPYHDSARRKYALRGMPYPFADPPSAGASRENEAQEIFRRRGIPVRIGG